MDFRKHLINKVLQNTNLTKLEAYTMTNDELRERLAE